MAGKLDGYDKAAILLMTLGEDLASQIMKGLDPKDLRKISGLISKSSNIPQEDVDAVLREFSDQVRKGMGVSVEGKDYLQKILTKALGEEKAAKVLENLTAPEEGGLDALKWMDAKAIASMIRGEHPQTITLILTHLDPGQAAQVLALLPAPLQADVMLRMATLEEIPPGVMKEIGEALRGEMSLSGNGSSRKVAGFKLAANILNQVDHTTEEGILSAISQNQPETAEKIRQLMFVFDDLIQIDDRGMQEIMKEVSKEMLALALKAAKEELKQKIFRNMSERAVQLLKEDMEARGPVKVSEVEKTQQAILKIVRRLVDEGKIVIGGKGEGDAVV
ncbi:MAG: flagellar motor switch protein FliG [Candidatus Manganitrophaceae bacterium]